MYVIKTGETKADIKYMQSVATDLMNRGIKIGDILDMSRYYNALRDNLASEINENYGIVNPNSYQQIVEHLKDLASRVDMNTKNDIIEICYNSDDNKWTSNADAMEKLSALGYDFATDILDYRKAKKYAETVDSLIKYSDNKGLIHPVVSLGRTNRINYSKPGLMSVPKKLLWNLIAPINEGDSLFSVDIKNQEPSILINYLNDLELKEALTSDKGLYETLFEKVFTPVVEMNMINDTLPENRVYSPEELRNNPFIGPAKYQNKKADCNSLYYNDELVIAIQTLCYGYKSGCNINYPKTVLIETEKHNVYELDVEWRKDFKAKKTADFTIYGDIKGIDIKISKLDRKEFKVAWNALSYGASAIGIDMICKSINGSKIYKYFNSIKAFKDYKKTISDIVDAGNNGMTTLFGNIVYSEDTDKKKLKRTLLDLPIQGTGADILSCLIKHFNEEVEKRCLNDYMFLYYTRHDELIIEVNGEWLKNNRDKVEGILRDILEHQIVNGTKEWIPFKVEVSEVFGGRKELFSDDE